MATIETPLTPAANQTPASVSLPSGEMSGSFWVDRFPTSKAIADCVDPFKSNLDKFVGAMTKAGATVSIAATLRPKERAFLMHWCWMIANKKTSAKDVPTMEGVNINWQHTDSAGKYSESASIAAAKAMVDGYGMQHLQVAPALNSRHTEGKAVDMKISWSGTLSITDSSGKTISIATAPRDGMNAELHAVGKNYGVIKYVGGDKDKPHWSDNGH